MTDFLEWGADFLLEMSETHTRQDVTLTWTVSGQPVTLQTTASLVDEDGRLIRTEIKEKIENTFFLFSTSDLLEGSVPLRRGIKVSWGDQSFVTVVQGNKCYYYNDTHQRTTVLITKHVPNTDN